MKNDGKIKVDNDNPPPTMRPNTAKGARYNNNLVVKSAHPTTTKTYVVDPDKYPKLANKIAVWAALKSNTANNSIMHEPLTTPFDGEGASLKGSIG